MKSLAGKGQKIFIIVKKVFSYWYCLLHKCLYYADLWKDGGTTHWFVAAPKFFMPPFRQFLPFRMPEFFKRFMEGSQDEFFVIWSPLHGYFLAKNTVFQCRLFVRQLTCFADYDLKGCVRGRNSKSHFQEEVIAPPDRGPANSALTQSSLQKP